MFVHLNMLFKRAIFAKSLVTRNTAMVCITLAHGTLESFETFAIRTLLLIYETQTVIGQGQKQIFSVTFLVIVRRRCYTAS